MPGMFTAPLRRFWLPTIAGLLVTLLLGVFLGSIIIQIAQRAPPVEMLAMYDAGDIAAHDGRIFIYQRIQRTRICQTLTTRFLYTMVNHDGEKVPSVVPLEPDSSIPFTDLGTSSWIQSFKLPDGLWPGEWKFVSKSVDYCSPLDWLAPRRHESAPIVVDIERARANKDVPITAAVPGGGIRARGRSPLQ
jgi:hypothetical protein